MKNKLKNPVLLLVPAALSVAPGTAQATIRYCRTSQQISACLATGGTTNCRTNVCQCLF